MAVTVNLCPIPKLQFNQNGVPLAGAQLFTYAAGTSTKLATYSDAGGNSTNNNPIILDANGQCDCYLQGGQSYKLVLAPSTDTDPPQNPYWTEDNITGINQVLSTYGADVGVANAYAVNLNPAITSYADGQEVVFDAANTNTGASTLNVNGLGPKQLLVAGVATPAGVIAAGQRYVFSYSEALDAFVQLGTSLSALVGSSLSVSGASSLNTLAVSGNATLNGITTIVSLTSGTSGSAQPLQVKQAIGNGIATDYPNLTTSRAAGATYTNNTGRPLWVVISFELSAGGFVSLQNSAGSVLYDYGFNPSASAQSFTLHGLIPPGSTYTLSATGVTLADWWEY